MSLLHLDGFEHYATGQLERGKWTQVDAGPATSTAWTIAAEGRFGNCVKRESLSNAIPGYLGFAPLLTQGAIWTPTASGVCGFALKIDDLSKIDDGFGWEQPLLSIYYGGHWHIRFCLQNDGTISVYRNTGSSSHTFLAASAEAVTDDVWVFLEFKWHIADAGGSCEVQAGGNTILTFSGDTKNSQLVDPPPAFWNAIRVLELPSSAATPKLMCRMCDFRLFDQSGSENNDFIGDRVIGYIRPNGVGAQTQWTPNGAGDNYTKVDEVPPDDDTTYISASAAGLRDLFEMEDVLGDPFGIQLVAFVRKETEGSATVKASVRSGGTTYDHDVAQNIADTEYSYLVWPYDTNPDTGLPWTEAELSAAQAGIVKVT